MTPNGEGREPVTDFEEWGITAFTTTRRLGSFGTASDEPVSDVMGRWSALQESLRRFGPRFASAAQVHGDRVVVHTPTWEGWLRVSAADGHASLSRGTAMAVSVADCVPIFLAHPSGAAALLHSGWRGTVARIIDRGLDVFERAGHTLAHVRVHLGPAICGGCYEVSPDVYGMVTGQVVERATPVDLRAVIGAHARTRGVRSITVSAFCPRCDNDRFYSHRAGDAGRQLAVMVAKA